MNSLREFKEIGVFNNYEKLTINACIDRVENHIKSINAIVIPDGVSVTNGDIVKLLSLPKAESYWEEKKNAEEVDGKLISNYVCPSCGTWKREITNFCPDCGVRLSRRKEEK